MRMNMKQFMAFCDAERSLKLSSLKCWKVNEEDRYFSCLLRSGIDIDFPKDTADLGRWIKWLRGRKGITDDAILEFIDISLIYIRSQARIKRGYKSPYPLPE